MTDYALTAASYDTIATEYAEHFGAEVDEKPLGRAMLGAFAEIVSGPVADLGCGTGRTTALLAGLGVDVFGVDLAPGMLAAARARHPGVRFEAGSMHGLALPDEALDGIVSWYSIIHTAPADLPGVLAEFHRVLRPGGHLALAFQIGDTPLRLTEGFGHEIDLTFHRYSPAEVTTLLANAGIHVTATLTREADPTERTPQAHLLAQRDPR